MKTTFDLPDDLSHALKLRAVIERRTVKDLVADYLRKGLGYPDAVESDKPSSSRVRVDASGLPTFVCEANAPASRMTVEKLLALEQEALSAEDARRAGQPF